MSATQKFLKEAQKTPMERMREQVLGALGLTEEALAQMSRDERRSAEDKIREMIEEKIRQGMNGGDKSPGSNAEMMEQIA
jgi:pyrroline-5-carboxylate reductase